MPTQAIPGTKSCYDCNSQFSNGQHIFLYSNDGGIKRYICDDCYADKQIRTPIEIFKD